MVLCIDLFGHPTCHALIFISEVMKTLVYDIPVHNAEELIARIAVAAGEIRDIPEVFPEFSDFHAPET